MNLAKTNDASQVARLAWRWQASITSVNARWWLWGSCMGLACILLLFSSVYVYRTRQLQTQLHLEQARWSHIRPDTSPPPTAGDFTQLLESLNTQAALQSWLAAVGRGRITMTNMAIQEFAGTPAELARVEIRATLQGNYVAIKQSLIDFLAEERAATVRQLRLVRDAAGVGIEAQVVLSVWGPPAGSSPTPSAATTPAMGAR